MMWIKSPGDRWSSPVLKINWGLRPVIISGLYPKVISRNLLKQLLNWDTKLDIIMKIYPYRRVTGRRRMSCTGQTWLISGIFIPLKPSPCTVVQPADTITAISGNPTIIIILILSVNLISISSSRKLMKRAGICSISQIPAECGMEMNTM